MTPASNQLWWEAFQTYRYGILRRPGSGPVVFPSRRIDFLQFASKLGRVSLPDRLRLRHLDKHCGAGLNASRAARFGEATERFREAEQILHLLGSDPGSEVAWKLGLSSYQSRMAYLMFRLGRIDDARSYCEAALGNDEWLERRGFTLQQLHRIQQGRNFVRMDLQLGNRRAAVELTGHIVAYLEGQVDHLPFHSQWYPRALRAVPRAILRSVIDQVVGETASYVVTGEDPDDEWRVLTEASRLYDRPEAAVFPQVQHALRAERARLQGQPDLYLRELTAFFSFGIRECPQLWYSLMVSWIEFCEKVGSRLALQVRAVLLRDSHRWKGVSRFILDRLHSPRTSSSLTERDVA